MITTIKTAKGYERLTGNPMLTSLDGKTRAPLRTILHASWSNKDRAAYGVYLAEPFKVPDGMRRTGEQGFAMSGGVLKEVYEVEPVSVPVVVSSPAEEALSKWAKSLGLTLDEVRKVLTKGVRK